MSRLNDGVLVQAPEDLRDCARMIDARHKILKLLRLYADFAPPLVVRHSTAQKRFGLFSQAFWGRKTPH